MHSITSHTPTSGTNSLIARQPTSVLPQFGNDFVGLQPAQTVCISRCRLRACLHDRRRVPSARQSSGGRDCPDGKRKGGAMPPPCVTDSCARNDGVRYEQTFLP